MVILFYSQNCCGHSPSWMLNKRAKTTFLDVVSESFLHLRARSNSRSQKCVTMFFSHFNIVQINTLIITNHKCYIHYIAGYLNKKIDIIWGCGWYYLIFFGNNKYEEQNQIFGADFSKLLYYMGDYNFPIRLPHVQIKASATWGFN